MGNVEEIRHSIKLVQGLVTEMYNNFDYPSPDYPPVSVNRNAGETQCVSGEGGKYHACFVVNKVRHPAVCSCN